MTFPLEPTSATDPGNPGQTAPPAYLSATSEVSLPAYAPANVAPFPPTFPSALTLRHPDRPGADITVTNPDNRDRVVFQVVLVHPRESPGEQRQTDAGEGWEVCANVVVAVDGSVPYAIRKHTPTGNYDIVASPSSSNDARPDANLDTTQTAGQDEPRRLTTKTSLFKTKHVFRGLAGREWAWKGNVARTLTLYEYPLIDASASASASHTATSPPPSATAPPPASSSSSSSKEKRLLAELTRTSSAATLHFLRPPTTDDPTPPVETAALVLSSLLPLLFAHRHHVATHFTTEADLARLQREVRPSSWDAAFLSAGKGSVKQEKFKSQMERERERERRERSQSRNRNEVQGVIPVQQLGRTGRARTSEGDEEARGRQ